MVSTTVEVLPNAIFLAVIENVLEINPEKDDWAVTFTRFELASHESSVLALGMLTV